ncbi:ADP-ribosylation/Crystallin J1 [hydrothermal vent metagenome]|uniref:ADP-ribosylation/Crystallin J1 n=1 Tax=hydrothermal vent metagenome TaxID=652676 RepID=A0A3B1C7M3_9ZZZZ
MAQPLLLKFQGALMGTFAGDALGMPFEGVSVREIARRFGCVEEMEDARLGAGTYTDDTEMMIGLAETLVEHGRVQPESFAQNLVSNFNSDRGYGGGSLKVLKALKGGVSWEQAPKAAFAEGSMGNGAAMRIAPVGVLNHHDLDLLEKEAKISAKVTHTHPLGVEGAKLQALAVGLAAREDSKGKVDSARFLDELKIRMKEKSYGDALDCVARLLSKSYDPETVARELGNEVTALRSVPASIYCFLKFNGDFKKSVSEAVSLGGDTDTIGAMTGALAGARLGVDAIPAEWLDALENGEKGRDYVMELGRRLYETGNR